MADREKTVNEEAGLGPEWTPVEAAPIKPGQTPQMTPFNSRGDYFSGSLAATMQHDTSFTKTQYPERSGIPGQPLWPVGASAVPSEVAAVQSTATTIINQIINNLPPPVTPVPTTDGLVHGDDVWIYDSAFVNLRDEFAGGDLTSGTVGNLGWFTPSSANLSYQARDEAPYIGQLNLRIPATTASSLNYIVPGTTGNATFGGSTTIDAALALFDKPGWKLTWVFAFYRGSYVNGANAFDLTKLSFYIGLAMYNGNNLTRTRPPIFYGCRFDTDPTAPAISDTTFHLEACNNADNDARYNNQGTNGGVFDTGITPAEATWYRLEIECLADGQLTMTLNGAGTTFTISKHSDAMAAGLALNANGIAAIETSNSPTSQTNGPPACCPGTQLTMSGWGVGFSSLNSTFKIIQNDALAQVEFFSPGGFVTTNPASTFTTSCYPGVYPFCMIGNDTQGTAPAIGTRCVAVDLFDLVWNKGLAGDSTVSAAEPRYTT